MNDANPDPVPAPPGPAAVSSGAGGGRNLCFGIDVGGTKILGVATDAAGTVAARFLHPTPKVPSQVPVAIAEMADQLVTAVGPPQAIGVGVPGLVDHDGVLRYGPNVPGVIGLDMASRLRERFDVPTAADNDGTCAALAEHRYGAARGHQHAVIITQGTGIGGGLIVNDAPLRGAHGFAGEPGHMLIDRFGPTCACGKQGCWEAVASGAGLANVAKRAAEEGQARRVLELAGGEVAHIRGEHVTAAFAEGDSGAYAIVDRFAWWVAEGVASLINLLDCSIVVLGGGLAVVSAAFIPDVQRRVGEKVLGSAYRNEVPIVAAQLGVEAGAVGASILGRDLLTASPSAPTRSPVGGDPHHGAVGPADQPR